MKKVYRYVVKRNREYLQGTELNPERTGEFRTIWSEESKELSRMEAWKAIGVLMQEHENGKKALDFKVFAV